MEAPPPQQPPPPQPPPQPSTTPDASASNNRSKHDTRHRNITAAQAVANTLRTSLGPKAMDKIIQKSSGDVIITNDGATILKNTIEEQHQQQKQSFQPSAKFFVELSKSQDAIAGDGTTAVVILAGELLKQCSRLLGLGIHPSIISDALRKMSDRGVEVLSSMAIPLEISNRDVLVNSAFTSLNSKLVSQCCNVFASIAVDAVLSIIDYDHANDSLVDLRDVKVVKKLGGRLDETELVKGLVIDTKVSRSVSGITRVENAKIGVIQFQISGPKTDIDQGIVVSDCSKMDRVLKEEREYVLGMVNKIKGSGCNVVLIQKSVLRDAVTDLALHYLGKANIMVIKDVERDYIEFVTKTLNCLPIASIEGFRVEKLGKADLVEEVSVGESKIVKITGIKDMGRTATVVIRGLNQLVLDEAERSLHDALCVVRCLMSKRFLISGGGAPEIELSRQLRVWAKSLRGMEGYCVKHFAEAFEVIPYTLAENAGLNPIKIVTELRNKHSHGEVNAGINVRKGCITNVFEENVVQPLLVSTSAISLATECARMIMKIDDIVVV